MNLYALLSPYDRVKIDARAAALSLDILIAFKEYQALVGTDAAADLAWEIAEAFTPPPEPPPSIWGPDWASERAAMLDKRPKGGR